MASRRTVDASLTGAGSVSGVARADGASAARKHPSHCAPVERRARPTGARSAWGSTDSDRRLHAGEAPSRDLPSVLHRLRQHLRQRVLERQGDPRSRLSTSRWPKASTGGRHGCSPRPGGPDRRAPDRRIRCRGPQPQCVDPPEGGRVDHVGLGASGARPTPQGTTRSAASAPAPIASASTDTTPSSSASAGTTRQRSSWPTDIVVAAEARASTGKDAVLARAGASAGRSPTQPATASRTSMSTSSRRRSALPRWQAITSVADQRPGHVPVQWSRGPAPTVCASRRSMTQYLSECWNDKATVESAQDIIDRRG